MSSLSENPNCFRTHAAFRLIAHELDPAAVTRALGVQPSKALVKDQLVPGDEGVRRQPTGVWALSTDDRVASSSLERHLTHLLGVLEPAAGPLAELQREYGAVTDFFCFWMSLTGHGGPMLSPAVLERIAALGADLEFDFYDASDGGDDGDDPKPPPPPAAKPTGLTLMEPPPA